MRSLLTLHRRLVDSGPQGFPERLLFWGLCGFSLLYRGLVGLRVAAYNLHLVPVFRAAVPVVSVGNLTVGGTGKTPVVDLLLRWAAKQSLPVAVVSRGYGGRPGKEALLVADGKRLLVTDAALCGDEPLLLARRNPEALVVVAPRRAAGMRLAQHHGARLIILDDGFQHLSVARDLDIVLLDSCRPFGNGQLLPAGILRESPSHLQRAGLVILTRFADKLPGLPSFAGPVLRGRHHLAKEAVSLDGERVLLAALAGHPCVAFAGIAGPGQFFASLRREGITPLAEIQLEDHQMYTPATVAGLIPQGEKTEFFLTTEKDAVKLHPDMFPRKCYYVPLQFDLEPQGELERAVRAILSGKDAI